MHRTRVLPNKGSSAMHRLAVSYSSCAHLLPGSGLWRRLSLHILLEHPSNVSFSFFRTHRAGVHAGAQGEHWSTYLSFLSQTCSAWRQVWCQRIHTVESWGLPDQLSCRISDLCPGSSTGHPDQWICWTSSMPWTVKHDQNLFSLNFEFVSLQGKAI